ncbi:MAG: ABC transporter permease [Pseudomonadales bacterium]|nr:ABC transporter permease [Pseudomonadales bacterium]
MLDRLLASSVKEILLFWRDPRSRSALFAMPIMQVVIFGLAATLEVRHVDLAIINEDSGRWSQELISRVESASFMGSTAHFDSVAQFTGSLERREVLLGLHFPADFSRNIVAGRPASVQLIVDGRRANAGQVTASYVRDIAAGLGMELAGMEPQFVNPPQAAVRHWFNPNLYFRWFMVPNLAASLSMMIALLITSLSIARERELGTFDQLLVSPSTPLEIIASKIVPALLAGSIVGIIITAIAVFGFGVPFYGNLFLLFGAMLPYLVSVVGVGLVISSMVKTQQQAVLGLFFVMIPMMVISGFATPVENMPLWLQYIAEASPLKHFLIIVQGSFLKSMPAADVWSNVWPMLVIGAVTLTTATLFVQRRLQ